MGYFFIMKIYQPISDIFDDLNTLLNVLFLTNLFHRLTQIFIGTVFKYDGEARFTLVFIETGVIKFDNIGMVQSSID